MQETRRKLNKLVNTKIIEKNLKGNFSLTIFGNMLIKMLSAINFLSNHQKYFQNTDDIPIKFIHKIGEVEACNLVTGFAAIIEYIKRMFANCEEYIYSVLPQVPLELIHTGIPLVKDRKIKLKRILPIYALIPK